MWNSIKGMVEILGGIALFFILIKLLSLLYNYLIQINII